MFHNAFWTRAAHFQREKHYETMPYDFIQCISIISNLGENRDIPLHCKDNHEDIAFFSKNFAVRHARAIHFHTIKHRWDLSITWYEMFQETILHILHWHVSVTYSNQMQPDELVNLCPRNHQLGIQSLISLEPQTNSSNICNTQHVCNMRPVYCRKEMTWDDCTTRENRLDMKCWYYCPTKHPNHSKTIIGACKRVTCHITKSHYVTASSTSFTKVPQNASTICRKKWSKIGFLIAYYIAKICSYTCNRVKL